MLNLKTKYLIIITFDTNRSSPRLGCDKITDLLQKGVEWPRGLGVSIAGGSDNMGL